MGIAAAKNVEKEKGEGERRGKHIRRFLLISVGVADFIFHKKSISVMSKYHSKSAKHSCRYAIF